MSYFDKAFWIKAVTDDLLLVRFDGDTDDREIQVEAEWQLLWQPGEEQTWDHPGSGDYVDDHKITKLVATDNQEQEVVLDEASRKIVNSAVESLHSNLEELADESGEFPQGEADYL